MNNFPVTVTYKKPTFKGTLKSKKGKARPNRALGTSPRALGTNPRAKREQLPTS
jgi:hypothetical protein